MLRTKTKEISMSPTKPILKVLVDRSRCCGYGLCAQVCPEIYELDADGLVVLAMDTVPDGMEEAAREGAAACPAEAITIVETSA
jgi:ferredoxin